MPSIGKLTCLRCSQRMRSGRRCNNTTHIVSLASEEAIGF